MMYFKDDNFVVHVMASMCLSGSHFTWLFGLCGLELQMQEDHRTDVFFFAPAGWARDIAACPDCRRQQGLA